jgi:hypothetical protein
MRRKDLGQLELLDRMEPWVSVGPQEPNQIGHKCTFLRGYVQLGVEHDCRDA